MKIGFIVDGEAEYRSLPPLLRQIERESQHVLLNPLLAKLQPLAHVSRIVAAVAPAIKILRGKQAQKVIILIDRENREVCSGAWAAEITNALAAKYGSVAFGVVIKNSCFENWLVADTRVFTKLPKRFSLSDTAIRKIQPNKADRIDAQKLIKEAARGNAYHKVTDAMRIMAEAEIMSIAANSRSFRRFLRMLDHPRYRDQSRNPG
ncbi:MAG TPA: DUF4276 family protein [Herpetosiphonaceae bacterium]